LTTPAFGLSKIDATTLIPEVQLPIDIFFFGIITAMAVSPDNRTLFVVGPSYSAFANDHRLVSRFIAYDAETLDERAWSPLSFGTRLPFNLAMSPDGSRIFVLAADDPTNPEL